MNLSMKNKYLRSLKSSKIVIQLYKLDLRYKVAAILLFFSIIKLWLVSGQHPYIIGDAVFDDKLFINLANNILNGHWLGQYNNLTLIKGPFYPLYIVLMNYIHAPLLISEQILYILSCFIFLICVWPLLNFLKETKTKYRLDYIVLIILGILIIYNPISSDSMTNTRVIREGIYPSLTLITISLFIALVAYRITSLWKYVLISITAGIFLSAFWLTREEGSWILPCIIAIIGYLTVLIILGRKTLPKWKWKLAGLILPIATLYLSITIISTINYHYYQVDNTVELKTPQFLSAYSSLTRVKSSTWLPVIPVSVQTRQLIYKVSPEFALLKPYLDGNSSSIYVSLSSSSYPQYSGEIAGGWFIWALRDSVTRAGYYTNGTSALNYYSLLASQVNSACKQGRLNCVQSTNSLYPPISKHYIRPFVSTLYKSFFYLAGFQQYNPTPPNNTSDQISTNLFVNTTYQKATNSYSHKRILVLKYIGDFYQDAFLVLTCIALASYLILLPFKKSYSNPIFIVTGIIGITIISRMVLLSFISVSSFSAINLAYFSSVYPFLIIFDTFSLIILYSFLINRSNKNTNKHSHKSTRNL